MTDALLQELAASAPRYMQIYAVLRRRIEAGEWSPGQAWPSRQALARQCGVSLPTAAAATRKLTEAGLLTRSRRGRP